MKIRITTLIALIGAYIGTYAFNSAMGGYWPIPDEAKPVAALSEPEDILWQGRYGYYSARWSTPLGAFYSPLLRIDWKWNHKSHRIWVDDFDEWFYASSPLQAFHPEAREYVALMRILKKKSDALRKETVGNAADPMKQNRIRLEAASEHQKFAEEGERLLRKSGWR